MLPAAVYLGLGGGGLPDSDPFLGQPILNLSFDNVRAERSRFVQQAWVQRHDVLVGMQATGSCLLKAVTRLFATTVTGWDEGTASALGQWYQNRLSGWEVYIAGLQRGRRTLRAVASLCAFLLGEDILQQYIWYDIVPLHLQRIPLG